MLFQHLADASFQRTRLLEIRRAVEPILANNLLPHFTDHSVHHSDQLVKLVDQLIESCQRADTRLNDDELYILYASCYLHDIGMQFEKPFDLELGDISIGKKQWYALGLEGRQKYLRDHHAAISAELVSLSVDAPEPVIGFQLKAEDHPAYISQVCRAHTINLPEESTAYDALMQSRPGIDLRLVSGLLRVADILDEVSSRALNHRANTLDLDIVSQSHWWRHYSTDSVHFESKTRSITISFSYAKNTPQSVHLLVKQLQFTDIKAEFDRHAKPFYARGVTWRIDEYAEQTPYNSKKPIPDHVLDEMQAIVSRSSVARIDDQLKAGIELYDDARAAAEVLFAQIRELSTETSVAEIVDLHLEAADLFNSAGAVWNERLSLQSAYDLQKSQGDSLRLIEIGNRLSEVCIRIDHDELAGQTVTECLQACNSLQVSYEYIKPTLRLQALSIRNTYQVEVIDNAYLSCIQFARQNRDTSELADVTLEYANTLFAMGRFQHCRELLKGLPVKASAEIRSSARSLSFLLSAISTGVLGKELDDSLLGLTTRAFAHHLAGEDEASCKLLEQAMVVTFDRNVKLKLSWNRLKADHNFLGKVNDHADLSDLSRLIDHGTEYYWQLHRALKDHIFNEHISATTKLWKNLLLSLDFLDWTRYKQSHQLLALELQAQARLTEGLMHAYLAQDSNLCEELSGEIRDKLVSDEISEAFEIATLSHLKGHFASACEILKTLLPLCNNEQIHIGFEFVFARASSDFRLFPSDDSALCAWQTLSEICSIVNSTDMGLIASKLSELDYSNVAPQLRKEIYSCASQASRHLTSRQAYAVANPILVQLETDEPDLYSYEQAVSAVCNLAARMKGKTKAKVGDRLLPPGVPVHLVRLLAIDVFEKSVKEPDGVDKFCHKAVEQLRLQVQVQTEGEEPIKPQFEGFRVQRTFGNRQVTSYQADVRSLQLLVILRKKASRAAVERVATEIISLVTNLDNLLPNRVALLQILVKFADVLQPSKKVMMVRSLLPLAMGQGVSEVDLDLHRQAQLPLSRQRINFGDPSDLSHCALLACGALSTRTTVQQVSRLIRVKMSSSDFASLGAGMAAAEYLPELDVVDVARLALAVCSSDDRVVGFAVGSLVRISHEFTDQQSDVIVSAIEQMAQSGFELRRSYCAVLSKAMDGKKLRGPAQVRNRRVLEHLRHDPSFRVRQRAKQNAS